MTHTHEWKVANYGGFASARCQDRQCKAEMFEEELEKCLRACAGVTLGEGADVKELIETFQEVTKWFGNVHGYQHFGALVDMNEAAHKSLLEKARTILAPFVESEKPKQGETQ